MTLRANTRIRNILLPDIIHRAEDAEAVGRFREILLKINGLLDLYNIASAAQAAVS